MTSKGAWHVLLALFLVTIVVLGVGLIAAYPALRSLMNVRQTVLVVNPAGTAQTKIAETWIDGNFTSDSGTSGLKSEQQVVYVPSASIGGNPTINNQGSVGYSVKAITYSFSDVAKLFGVQVEVLIYQANITVQIIASQVDGSAVFKLNGPSSVMKGYTYQTEGQIQVPISGITDITSELKARSAPYGTYVIKVTTTESWSLWAQNVLTPLQGLAFYLYCWITKGLTNPACEGLHQVQGPSTTVLSSQTGNVTYGAVNQATFYMTLPPDPITVGTASGQTKVFELSFIPAGGFTGTVHVSFAGMPSGMSVTCQDQGCNDVALPAAPVTYKVTVTSQTQLGNYTLTATATSGTITRTGTFMINVIENAGPNQCPPICTQANTVLAADTSKTSYAPYDPVTVKGTLTVTNGVAVNGGEIDIKDATTGKLLTQAATGTDGKFSATFLAPGSSGDYAIIVSYPGDLSHTASSVTISYSVNQLPPWTLYLIIIAVVAVIVILLAAGMNMMRRKGP